MPPKKKTAASKRAAPAATEKKEDEAAAKANGVDEVPAETRKQDDSVSTTVKEAEGDSNTKAAAELSNEGSEGPQSNAKGENPEPEPAPAPELEPETTKTAKTKTEQKPKDTKKRKAPPAPPKEGSRKSARGSRHEPSTPQLLNFLLSKEAEDLCRPEDEHKALQSSKGLRTYTSILNPYEELLCSVILSRPISHMLGLRTIRTVLNEPYSFTSAKKTQEAGADKWQQAVYDAKTQHKDKTAQQIGGAADVVLTKFTSDNDKDGAKLGKILESEEINDALEDLKREIKGFGATSIDIFLRRVQWLWKHAFPYIDGKSADGLRDLGLPMNAEELEELLNTHWKELDTSNVAGHDEESKKRRAFVVLLERATGAGLENKLQRVKEAAAANV